MNKKVYEYDMETRQSSYIYTDHLGSVRMIADEGGRSIWEADYYAFGQQFATLSRDRRFNYGFTGKEFDPESGLNYYGARFYDPNLGRFLQVDVFNHQERYFNPYVYCADNPLTYVDPDGKWKAVRDKDGWLIGWEKDGNNDTVEGLMQILGLKGKYGRQIAESIADDKMISFQDFEVAIENVFADFVQDMKDLGVKLLDIGALNNIYDCIVDGDHGCIDQSNFVLEYFVGKTFDSGVWKRGNRNTLRIVEISQIDIKFPLWHNYQIIYQKEIVIKADSWPTKKGVVKVLSRKNTIKNLYLRYKHLGIQNYLPSWLPVGGNADMTEYDNFEF